MAQHPLTGEQTEIVGLPLGCWLVTAPPGCGKTEVLARRVEHLLQQSARSRSRVLVLTFTKKAAENVTERVQVTLPQQAARVVAQRFHQFCHEVLRQQAPERLRTLYEGKAERLLALQRALDDEGLGSVDDAGLGKLLEQIEFSKKTLAFEGPTWAADEQLRPAFDAYVRYQQREKICDYDDLILDVLSLFRAGEFPVSAYRQMYTSVLVDEAQDLNPSQYALVSALLGHQPTDVMFFADHRQSIYAFNGADLGLLETFVTQFNAGRKQLTLSFRCGAQIVAAANAVAASLRKTPDPLRPDGSLARGGVEVHSLGSEADEASFVVAKVEELLRTGLPPAICHPGERLALDSHDIAVLGRSRRALERVEQQLREKFGDVVTSYGRDDSMGSLLGRTAVWALRAQGSPGDLIVARQLLSSVGDEFSSAALSTPAVVWDLIAQSKNAGVAAVAASAKSTSSGAGVVPSVLDALEFHLPNVAEDEADELKSDLEWLRRIRTQLRRKLQREPEAREFTQELTMTSLAPAEGQGVRVLTMHAAKGREFKVVILVGLREGSFPSFFAKTPRELDEERRLAYVAVTRTSRLLIMTYAKSWVTSYGNVRAGIPSVFVAEIVAATRAV